MLFPYLLAVGVVLLCGGEQGKVSFAPRNQCTYGRMVFPGRHGYTTFCDDDVLWCSIRGTVTH